jgi:acyltransferase
MRIVWIDVAKAYGMILVFYGHIVERFVWLGYVSAQFQLKFIYAFHMPLFFILSGYILANKKNNFRFCLASRIVPYIFFNLLALLIEIPKDILSNKLGQNLSHYAHGLLSFIRGYPTFNFMTWFLVCLFTVEIIDFVLRQHIKTNRGLFIAATYLYLAGNLVIANIDFFTSSTGILKNYWYVHESLVMYIFYQLGSICKHSNFLEKETSSTLQILTLIFTGLFFFSTLDLNSAVNTAVSVHGNVLLFPLTAIAGSLFLISIAKLTPPCSLILFFGQNTLVLLGLNGLFYHFVNEPCTRQLSVFLPDSQLAVFVICGLATLASLAISFPCVLVLNKFLPQLVGKPRIDGPILKRLV